MIDGGQNSLAAPQVAAVISDMVILMLKTSFERSSKEAAEEEGTLSAQGLEMEGIRWFSNPAWSCTYICAHQGCCNPDFSAAVLCPGGRLL